MNKFLKYLAVAAMFTATSAQASLLLSIDEITAGDTDAAVSTSSSTGSAVLATSTANFNLAIGVGSGEPILSLPNVMDLGISANSNGAGTLQVTLTAFDLSGFDFASMESTAIISGGAGTFDVDLYLDALNLGNATTLISSGSTGTIAGSDFSTLINGDFSLTMVATLETNSSGVFYSTDTLVVPEPSIIALFGLGLAGLGFSIRRRKAK